MVEIIIYVVLFILTIFLFAILLDVIRANKSINNRGDKYFSFYEFYRIITMTAFNQEKRFNSYIKLVDPISKLVLESIGFNPNSMKTYKDDESIHKYMNKYVLGEDLDEAKLYEKKDMLNFLNSEKFDTYNDWTSYPQLIFPFVIDIPEYDEKKTLKPEDVIKITELLKDDTIRRKIISNKAFNNHLKTSISAIEKIIDENTDESKRQYLSLRIEMIQLALNSSKIHCNSIKEEQMSQFK